MGEDVPDEKHLVRRPSRSPGTLQSSCQVRKWLTFFTFQANSWEKDKTIPSVDGFCPMGPVSGGHAMSGRLSAWIVRVWL